MAPLIQQKYQMTTNLTQQREHKTNTIALNI